MTDEEKAPAAATVTPIRPGLTPDLAIEWVRQAQDDYAADVTALAKRAGVANAVHLGVLRRKRDGVWLARLHWDGQDVHLSEHGTAQDATLAVGEAFARGATLRWRP
jgi:hypothetical protein